MSAYETVFCHCPHCETYGEFDVFKGIDPDATLELDCPACGKAFVTYRGSCEGA